MPGTGVVAGALRDCSKHEMSNFIVDRVVDVGDRDADRRRRGVLLQRRASACRSHHDQEDSASKDGLFMLIQLPPSTSAYVQAWGYPTDADVASGKLKLIAELAVPVSPTP